MSIDGNAAAFFRMIMRGFFVTSVSLLLVTSGCGRGEREQPTGGGDGYSEKETRSLVFDGGQLDLNPCETVTAIEWMDNDELVFAGGGFIMGWDVDEKIPAWIDRDPLYEEREREGWEKLRYRITGRMLRRPGERELLVNGYLSYGPSVVFRYWPQAGSDLIREVSYESFQALKGISCGPITWSPDGRMYTLGGSKGIEVLHVDGTPQALLHAYYPRSCPCRENVMYVAMAWSPDGTMIVGRRCVLGPLIIWKSMTGEIVDTIELPGSFIAGVAWGDVLVAKSTNGRVLGYDDGVQWQLKVRSSTTFDPEDYRPQIPDIAVFVVKSDCGRLFTIDYDRDGLVAVVDYRGKELLMVQGVTGRLSPDGSQLATVTATNLLLVWDMHRRKWTIRLRTDDDRLFPFSNSSREYLWSPSGRYLAFLLPSRGPVGGYNVVRILDTTRRAVLRPDCEVVDEHTLRGRLVAADDVSVVVE